MRLKNSIFAASSLIIVYYLTLALSYKLSTELNFQRVTNNDNDKKAASEQADLERLLSKRQAPNGKEQIGKLSINHTMRRSLSEIFVGLNLIVAVESAIGASIVGVVAVGSG